MEQQEYFMKMQMIEQEASRIDQQLQVMDQHIADLIAIKSSISEIGTTKEKEIMANLGKGIFVKAEIKTKDLLVNTGRNIFIKKTPEQTIEIIDNQISKLTSGKQEFTGRIMDLQAEMQEIVSQAQSSKSQQQDSQNPNSHKHNGHECKCEHDCGDKCKHK